MDRNELLKLREAYHWTPDGLEIVLVRIIGPDWSKADHIIVAIGSRFSSVSACHCERTESEAIAEAKKAIRRWLKGHRAAMEPLLAAARRFGLEPDEEKADEETVDDPRKPDIGDPGASAVTDESEFPTPVMAIEPFEQSEIEKAGAL